MRYIPINIATGNRPRKEGFGQAAGSDLTYMPARCIRLNIARLWPLSKATLGAGQGLQREATSKCRKADDFFRMMYSLTKCQSESNLGHVHELTNIARVIAVRVGSQSVDRSEALAPFHVFEYLHDRR